MRLTVLFACWLAVAALLSLFVGAWLREGEN